MRRSSGARVVFSSLLEVKMSGYGSNKEETPQRETPKVEERNTSRYDVGTNNESASSWGNGVVAESVTNSQGGNSIADSFSGISQDLASGASFGTSGRGRTQSDWTGFGAGGAYGGEINADGPMSWAGGFGLGAGGGGGSFQQSYTNQKSGWERSASGYGGGLGVGARVDSQLSTPMGTRSLGGDLYSGVGGNAYSFDDVNHKTGQGRSGVGVDANFTPLGVNDAYSSYSNQYGSVEARAGNIEVGRVGGTGEVYSTTDGGYGAQGGISMGRNTATDLEGTIDSPLGNTTASVGRVSQGRFYQGGIEQSADGSVRGNLERGGMLSVEDAALSHDGPLGQTEASLGRYGGNSPTRISGGYNATENRLEGEFQEGKGHAIENASISHRAGDAHAGASAGRVENGWRVDGGGHIDLDDGSANLHGNFQGGGVSAENVNAQYGYDGVMQASAHADTISNQTVVSGANLDVGNGQVNASVDQIRTGGIRATGVSAEQELLGMNSTFRAGELSNDLRVDGAYLNADSGGVDAGFQEIDGGGIRLKDMEYTNDLGGHGSLEARGSYSNGNTLTGGRFSARDGEVNASLDSFAVAGQDANVDVAMTGPGGTYANAQGTYHSGVTGTGLEARLTSDSASFGADTLGYDGHQVKDVHLSGGMEGVYDSEINVGEAHMSQFRANDVDASIDANGANLSVGETSYSHMGLSDFSSRQSIGDGAVGSEVDVGALNYAGGGVESAEFNSNFATGESSMNIDGANAHYITAEDVNVGVNVGDARANVGADSLAVGDAHIGNINAQSSNYGLTQSAEATDVDIGLIRAENLNAGLAYGDQNIVSASANVDASVGADRIAGDMDLTQGTASGAIENGRVTAMADGNIGIGDYNIDIGRTGVDANVNAAGEIDVMSGTASGSASLEGTELSAFGQSVELGEWAQASGGVDVSEGAANFNLGGENGVGADMNLSEGNLDVNIGGYEIDVDQGIRDAGNAIADTASAAGSAIASGASKAWDVVTSW